MAVSDPTTSVPTPTGTLQGAAAFSWDGATWQPAGAAYASVATPTGVLRGVAPFSSSSGVWQPAGQFAGALDRIALYTWNGSAWTPAGGAPDVPTSASGVLQGVAAFYFDGTNWQPTGQAAPEVATPSGVLTGMAMFSPVGAGWAPTVSPASLDLNFVAMSVLDPRITFTRASTATYFDANGVMQTAGSNVPRLDHDPVTHAARGLLIEESRTNALPQSANLAAAPWATGSAFGPAPPTVTANSAIAPDGTMTAAMIVLPACAAGGLIQVYQNNAQATAPIFSIYLRGAVGGEQTYLIINGSIYSSLRVTLTTSWQRFVVSGPANAAGNYVLIGTDLRDVTETATPAGTIYAWGAQLETGTSLTSYIPTTSTAVTRAADLATMAVGSWYTAGAGSVVVDAMWPFQPTGSCTLADMNDGTGANRLVLYNYSPIYGFGTAASVGQWNTAIGTPPAYGQIFKVGMAFAASSQNGALNGGAVVPLGTGSLPSGITTVDLGANNTGSNQLDGYLRRFRYWPRALSNAQLQQVTT